MFKLIGKKIIAILLLKNLLNWTFPLYQSVVQDQVASEELVHVYGKGQKRYIPDITLVYVHSSLNFPEKQKKKRKIALVHFGTYSICFVFI